MTDKRHRRREPADSTANLPTTQDDERECLLWHRPPEAIPTRADHRAELAAMGVTGAAAELVLDTSSAERHSARVHRFVVAALQEWERVHCTTLPPIDEGPDVFGARVRRDALAYAVAALVLEAFGLIDHPVGPTEASQKVHHRAFRQQCGARTGPAAGATHAAMREAVADLWRLGGHPGRLGEILVEADITPDGPAIVMSIDGWPHAVLCATSTAVAEAQPPGWLLTIGMEALRRAAGLAPWFALAGERVPNEHEHEASPHVLELVRIDGPPWIWAAIVEAAQERKRAAKAGKASPT